MMGKIFSIIILLLTLSKLSTGQDEKSVFIPGAITSGYEFLRDDGMSPLIYKGFNLGARFGREAETENRITNFNIYSHYGSLYTRNYETDGISAFNVRVEAQYSYLKSYRKLSNDIRWFLGGHLGSLFNGRLNSKMTNNLFLYESFTSLGISTLFEKDLLLEEKKFDIWFIRIIRPERNLKVRIKAELPLLGYGIRPNYITIPDFTDNEFSIIRDNIERGELLTPISYFRFKTSVSVARILENGNRLRWTYRWDYYTYPEDVNPVKSALHNISFALVFKVK